jgi:hypothetical protein
MTQAEKLEALVNSVVEHGFISKNFAWISEDKQALLGYWFTADNYKAVIFNHDFARALFGEKFVCLNDGRDVDQEEAMDTPWRVSCEYENGDYGCAVEAFKWQLQQAVVSDDPIGYMYGVVFVGKDE